MSDQTVTVSEETLGWLVANAGLADGHAAAIRTLARRAALSGRRVALGDLVRCCPDPSGSPGHEMPCYDERGQVMFFSQSSVPFGNCGPGGAAPPPAAPPGAPPSPPPPGGGPPPPPPPAPPPPPGCPPGMVRTPAGQCLPSVIDLTYTRPVETIGYTWVLGPFGMVQVPAGGAPTPPPAQARPAPRPAPAGVRIGVEEGARLLKFIEGSLEALCLLAERAGRCGASEADIGVSRAAAACMEKYRAAAGAVSLAADELCRARKEGRTAVLTGAQASGLAALEECMAAVGALAGAATGKSIWEAIIGLALPAVGAAAIAL